MKETLRGFCSVQGKEYSIMIHKISSKTLEDDKPKFEYGRIYCNHASFGGNCDGKNCSILEQNGITR